MKYLLLVFISFASLTVMAQDDSEYDPDYEFPESVGANFNVSAGLGLGLDYGGIGGKLVLTPMPNLSLFGSLGYNLNGAGYNGGVILRFLPDSKVSPYATGMYGYNAVIIIEGIKDANKTYYGPSFGGGIELNRRNSGNYWNFGILVPIRSSEFKSDVDAIKNDPNIEFEDALPISISVGYHFRL